MTLRFTMRGGHHDGRPIRPSLWCRRDESLFFSDFLRRSASTNSTAGTSFDFLAGFTGFIKDEARQGQATIRSISESGIISAFAAVRRHMRQFVDL